MKVQFVNDEGRVIEIVPGMRILLCQPERQDAPYMLSLVSPDGSLLATTECYNYKPELALKAKVLHGYMVAE